VIRERETYLGGPVSDAFVVSPAFHGGLFMSLAKHLLLALSLATATAAGAADSEGRFMVKGAGTATCAQFLAAKEARNSEWVSVAGSLDGYLTHVNQRESTTFDVAPWRRWPTCSNAAAKAAQRPGWREGPGAPRGLALPTGRATRLVPRVPAHAIPSAISGRSRGRDRGSRRESG
jgi:hypothetical protein